jgi:hypothetical protein
MLLETQKTTPVKHEVLKTAFDNNVMERTQALVVFSIQTWGSYG